MHFRNKLTKRKDWYIFKDLYNGTLFKLFYDQDTKGTPAAFERHVKIDLEPYPEQKSERFWTYVNGTRGSGPINKRARLLGKKAGWIIQ